MNEFKLKEFICEIGRRVYAKGFAAANDGNISIRIAENEVLCTPTMVSKGFLKPEDICKVDYDGKQISGTRKRTSEVLLHLAVYKNRDDVNGVVHCHPPHATAFAVAHEPIPKCVLPEVEVFLGEVPIAKYATPGDQRLPNTIVPYVKDELADVYAAAALVVSRAGAGTVNECCQLGLAALYVPLPGTRGDEQMANARLVERAGGAAVLPQAELTPARLVAEVKALLADPRRLKEMGERARRLAVPDAAERLVALLTETP